MSTSDDDNDPKTIFIPSSQPTGAPAPTEAEDAWFAGEPTPPPPEAPSQSTAQGTGEAGWANTHPPPAVSPPPQPSSLPEAPIASPPPSTPRRIEIGMVLNGIYRVERFIARGGMGEVYEGTNVSSGERVAIKIILAHLASDPKVLAMFMHEARTLTSLNHPALVRYRLLAEEPTLGVSYIVTEYIDGPSLRDCASTLKPSAQELVALIRRLAGGLEAAHDLGKIHRDIATDNILLPGGKLQRATIIDFGITKDLDPANVTIIGDGFAGKLDFVAPEQLGAYGRDVGPWTDVYSLGLVALAVVKGMPVPMGGSPFDAMEKRRQGPDLSAANDMLRPVIARMTASDPAQRYQSMADVIAALDQVAAGAPATSPPPPRRLGSATRGEKGSRATAPFRAPLALMIGGVVAVAAGIFLAAVLVWPKPHTASDADLAPVSASRTGPGNPIVSAQIAADSVSCSWIDVSDGPADGGGVLLLSGVAQNPSAASDRVAASLRRAGSNAQVDGSGIKTIAPSACPVLDIMRKYRQPPGAKPYIEVERAADTLRGTATYSLQPVSIDECDHMGGNQAKIVTFINPVQGRDFTLMGMEPDGKLTQLTEDAVFFNKAIQADPHLAVRRSDGSYQATPCVDEASARSGDRSGALNGYVVISGRPPFDLKPLSPQISTGSAVDQDWIRSFDQKARAGGWTTQMAWFRVSAN